MLFAFSVAPTVSDSADGSVSAAVADAVRVVRESGLPNETTSMFTTIEGEWDEVMPVIKRACEAVAEHSPRVSLVLKADLRPGYENQLSAKVERVEQHLRPE
ncbi:MTH1187 family thiamine-binding protein [uncultured Georgenia sp.]|uniref:MTH1187 family thiamine-binding protein n=1 Tax=uncultured Georgenia sp. TaxID=378209 RepID=UPI002633CEF2|nr:MTH1187 family thiamine-binding protein [uncultured Georgenia sp.]HLV03703.1 MTH1187 family thiamine-binding protein [Actinomycetaceae bacterium]